MHILDSNFILTNQKSSKLNDNVVRPLVWVPSTCKRRYMNVLKFQRLMLIYVEQNF